uniref:Uncharacterized protein n=1 Tax=Paulinella longichromatophora TaxID=1708747 RepID=A0A2H4ZNV1_9EUKA|nr:hypothetical protein PLO_184 [Paulinella longichromatophora]
MSLFSRLFGNQNSVNKQDNNTIKDLNNNKSSQSEAFYLDSDSSTGLGNMDFMRRSNKIRRTFPGNADNPGNKELIMDVASMNAKLEKASETLGGKAIKQSNIQLTNGIPNPPKKTFAQQMDGLTLTQKLRGSTSTGVNKPLSTAPAARKATQIADKESKDSSKGNSLSGVKPGSIDPFKSMAKELNN